MHLKNFTTNFKNISIHNEKYISEKISLNFQELLFTTFYNVICFDNPKIARKRFLI